jgi:hypothetical protein
VGSLSRSIDIKALEGISISGWTNADLPSFLEAMAAWSQDMDGFHADTGQNPSKVPVWRMMADMLMGARLYE